MIPSVHLARLPLQLLLTCLLKILLLALHLFSFSLMLFVFMLLDLSKAFLKLTVGVLYNGGLSLGTRGDKPVIMAIRPGWAIVRDIAASWQVLDHVAGHGFSPPLAVPFPSVVVDLG